MFKNPYLAHAQNIKIDAKNETIIKKARRFNVVVYENENLRNNLLDLKYSKIEIKNDMFDFFTWFLELEKNTHLSA